MQRNISQIKLAREVGVDSSLIARFEKGTRHVHRDYLAPLCRALNLSAFECERLYRTAGYVYNVNVTSLELMAQDTMSHFGFDTDIIETVDLAWKSLVVMANQLQEARN